MALHDIPLDRDPRWRRLHERPWTCPGCNERHAGLFDLACNKPDAWPGDGLAIEPNSAVLNSTNFLSEDFCVLNDEHFFVRCVLRLPIIGAPANEYFGFGVWSTLSRKNFVIYRDGFEDGVFENDGSWFGWFSNALKGYPNTFNLKCQVHPIGGRQRPWIEFEDIDHPLVAEWRQGISFDRLLDIYALNGHDIRLALLD